MSGIPDFLDLLDLRNEKGEPRNNKNKQKNTTAKRDPQESFSMFVFGGGKAKTTNNGNNDF